MKFRSDKDAKLFVIEVGKLPLAQTVDKSFSPSEELLELFVKRRRKVIPGLKNFRRSQLSKAQWRHGRFDMMKGIKKFHSSTKGKRFHRELGRFIATRDIFGSGLIAGSRSNESLSIDEVTSSLKAISSAKTHLVIPYEYYMSVDEYVDYMIFTEELLPSLNHIEEKILKFDFNFEESHLELVLRCIDAKVVIDEMSKLSYSDRDSLDKIFGDTDPLSPESQYSRYKSLSKHLVK